MQINIEPITVHDRTFLVVRDDLVIGGSKSRALQPLLRNHPDTMEYVYAGPTTGHAQIALALNCAQQNKRARIFCVGPLTPIQTFIRAQPGVTVVHREYASLKKVQRMAAEYCQKQDPSVFLVPFGFDFPEFRQLLEGEQLLLLLRAPINMNAMVQKTFTRICRWRCGSLHQNASG